MDEKIRRRSPGHPRRKLDLTGQRFGKLAVIAPAENIGSLTAWLCRCDCGQEVVVATKRLRDGRRISCGCDKVGEAPLPGLSARASLTYVDGTCVEMIRAGTKRCNNTSGVVGVNWDARKQRWFATICFKGKRHHLGSYRNFEDAVEARRKAEHELFEPFLREFAGAQNQGANG